MWLRPGLKLSCRLSLVVEGFIALSVAPAAWLLATLRPPWLSAWYHHCWGGAHSSDHLFLRFTHWSRRSISPCLLLIANRDRSPGRARTTTRCWDLDRHWNCLCLGGPDRLITFSSIQTNVIYCLLLNNREVFYCIYFEVVICQSL